MVEGHLNQGSFDSDIIKLGPKLVDASIELHRHVMNNFLPSAVKFHYQFNLRELSNITQASRSTHVISQMHHLPLQKGLCVLCMVNPDMQGMAEACQSVVDS